VPPEARTLARPPPLIRRLVASPLSRIPPGEPQEGEESHGDVRRFSCLVSYCRAHRSLLRRSVPPHRAGSRLRRSCAVRVTLGRPVVSRSSSPCIPREESRALARFDPVSAIPPPSFATCRRSPPCRRASRAHTCDPGRWIKIRWVRSESTGRVPVNPTLPKQFCSLAPAFLDFTSRSFRSSNFLIDRSMFLQFSPFGFIFFASKSLILFRLYLLHFSSILAFFMSMRSSRRVD
jgi:hypothetical protein